MNKDEADKCLQIGKQALDSGDLQKALKFFNKSNNMHPSDTAEIYLKKCEDVLSGA